MKQMLWGMLAAGAITPLVMFFLGKFLPLDKFYPWGEKCGTFCTSLGRIRMGKHLWESIEEFLQGRLGQFLDGFYAGLDHDDKNGNGSQK